jgi:predicted RNase H-related nuclease YkuK (DUF458 family)
MKSQKEYEEQLVKLEYLGLGDVDLDLIPRTNPLDPRSEFDIENPHIHILREMRKPQNFVFTCKHVFNIELAPFQLIILHELWYRKYPMLIASRGGSKSFMLSLYAMLRALLEQGSKIIVVGAAFRQAKVIFEYCETIWNSSPILRDLVGTGGRSGPRRDIDRCTLTIGDSKIIALPLGNGEKIRGQRANVIIADEFSSIPKDVYETVVSGFASVNASPVQAMKRAARVRVLKKTGQWTPEKEENLLLGIKGNQAIIAGTATYGFKHFAEYWREYKGIIESKGDTNKLIEVFKGNIPAKFNWKHYSVIRLPAELIPEDFMDEEHVARARITTDITSYQLEYGAVFASDSNGFYRRSLIESCVVRDNNLNNMLPGVNKFHALIKGFRDRKYIFAVDTASERDNFVITILELHDNHRREVYCWSTTRQKHIERIKSGTVEEKNYYAYCARKIRNLMKMFPCIHISMDSQQGGRQITEALHDEDKMEKGEIPIWEVIDKDDPKWSDDQPGLHIIELVNFADAQWTSDANHGLKKDMEDKVLLFPYCDPVMLADALKDDKKTGRVVIKDGKELHLGDTLEDVFMEIEEMKDELTTIVHTSTGTRDRWDVPEIKQAGGKKGRLRKDRYSALLMANMAARELQRAPTEVTYKATGGFAKDVVHDKAKLKDMPLYEAPDWFLNPEYATANYSTYGVIVQRTTRDGISSRGIGVSPNR